MKIVSVNALAPPNGTVLWIGSTDRPEYQLPFQYCIEHAPQIAIRATMSDAIERPASGVCGVVFARANRRPVSREACEQLQKCHREVEWLDLLGPLSAGLRESSCDEAMRIPWHRWEEVLCRWLPRSIGADQDQSLRGRSVAIVSSSSSVAESYLDLAESNGVTAIWCRGSKSPLLRNIDAVWWDDSVATAASAELWRERIANFRAAGSQARHAWITSSARHDQRHAALQGGVEVVLHKPHKIEPLLNMIESAGAETLERRCNAA